jgi:hypothetical protein
LIFSRIPQIHPLAEPPLLTTPSSPPIPSAQRHPPKPTDRDVRVVRTRTTDWFVLRIRTSIIDERAVIHRAWDVSLSSLKRAARPRVDRCWPVFLTWPSHKSHHPTN